MEDGLTRNTTVYISSRTHLNLSFNLCQCGVTTLLQGGRLQAEPEDTFTLYCVNRGSILLRCDQLDFRVSAGQGFFILPDVTYILRNLGQEEVECVWITFTGYQVETYLGRANIFRSKPVFHDDEGTRSALINEMYQAAQHFPNRYCKMMSGLYTLFGDLLENNPARQTANGIDTSNYYTSCAVEFIDNHYAKDIVVSDIADALGITRKHLYLVFRQAFHISPKQYLIYYRIEKACKRLKSTNQSVQEIAETVGYANQFYFSKEFKRLIGMSPTEYRNNPEHTEIFSYRTFASVLNEGGREIALPIFEELSEATYEPIRK